MPTVDVVRRIHSSVSVYYAMYNSPRRQVVTVMDVATIVCLPEWEIFLSKETSHYGLGETTCQASQPNQLLPSDRIQYKRHLSYKVISKYGAKEGRRECIL